MPIHAQLGSECFPGDDGEPPCLRGGQVLRVQLEGQYSLVYDVLGAATLRAWHEDCRDALVG